MSEENPILNTALDMINSVAPNFEESPEDAFRKLVDSFNNIIIKKNDAPSMEQLKILKEFEPFEDENLIQIKKI